MVASGRIQPQLSGRAGETGIEYDQRMQGTLQLFRKAEQMDAAGKDIEVLRADGVPSRCWTAPAASPPNRGWRVPPSVSPAVCACQAMHPAVLQVLSW